MNNYVDKYGRYHHKPCINGEPSSNNGWLFTAYAHKLGLPIDKSTLWLCYQASFLELPVPHVTRSPGKSLPPMSRDEVLGLVSIRVPTTPKKAIWNFSPFVIPPFNPIKLIQQLWQLRPNLSTTAYEMGMVWRHRNYFWENNLDQLYRFAFSVPLTDRHFVLSKWGKFNLIYWAIAKVDSFSSSKSGIRWLKYDKDLVTMLEEFPEDHPFRRTE